MSSQELISGSISFKFLSFKEKFFLHNLSTSRKKSLFILRIVCIAIAIATVLSSSIGGVGIPKNQVSCIQDNLFELTAPLNNFFTQNHLTRHLLLIFSSSLIDIQYLFFCIHYVFWGKSGRPIVFLVSFYLFRAFVQSIFMMKYPDGMIWDYPGIPSITISYDYTTDFFFSGHVGIMVFLSLENYKNKNYVMMGLGIFGVFAEFFVMVVLRGHYSIDLFSGIIFGHYFWMVSKKVCKVMDRKFKIKCREDGLEKEKV